MTSETNIANTLIDVLAGLWDDGFRKIILVNNHGMDWMMESAIQEFFKRYQLPAFATVVEWHRAVREFFYPLGDERPDFVSTPFIHADEAETSVALLMFPGMVDMSCVVDAQPKSARKVPDPRKFSLRPYEEIEICLREPMSEGWKSVHCRGAAC